MLREELFVSRFDFLGEGFLNLAVDVPLSSQGSLQGLLGDFNGDPDDDLKSRFGSVLTPPVSFERLYDEFGESWRVDNTGFEASPAESGSPARFLSASTLTRSQRQAAEQICRNAGVAGSLLKDCLLDVALLGRVGAIDAGVHEWRQGSSGDGGVEFAVAFVGGPGGDGGFDSHRWLWQAAETDPAGIGCDVFHASLAQRANPVPVSAAGHLGWDKRL